MKIKVIFFRPFKKNEYPEHEKIEFNGNYAIETMLIKISEQFFGLKISRQIEELLKNRSE